VSKRRFVITAVLVGASPSEVARTCNVSQGWIGRLMSRCHEMGEAAFEPRSRRPHARRTPPHPRPSSCSWCCASSWSRPATMRVPTRSGGLEGRW